MSLIMPDGSRTISYGLPGSGLPQREDFMGQAAKSGNKAATRLASLQPQPQQQPAAPQPPQQTQVPRPTQGLDMSAYRPSQAQPVPNPSQGTPYPPSQQSRGHSPATSGVISANPTGWYDADVAAGRIIDDRGMVPQRPPTTLPTQYSPSFLDAYQPPATNRPMPGQNGIPQNRQPANTQTYTTPSFTHSTGGTPQRGGQGNVANDPYGKPPPFVSTMTDMFGNPTTAEQFYPQQDAFIAQLLERMGQIQGGTWLGQGPPPQTFGRRPDMDFGEMWNQGGQMVNDGWRNPFSPGMASPVNAPDFGTPYQPGFGGGFPDAPPRMPIDTMRPTYDGATGNLKRPSRPLPEPTYQGLPPRGPGPAPIGDGPIRLPANIPLPAQDFSRLPRPGMAQPTQPQGQGNPYQPGFGGELPPSAPPLIPEYRPSQRDYTPQEFEEYRLNPPGRKDLGNVWRTELDYMWRDSDRLLNYKNYEHYLQDQNRVRRNAYESPSPLAGGRLNSQYADMYAPPMGGGWFY